MTISSAPVVDEPVTHEPTHGSVDEMVTTPDNMKQTTEIPKVLTKNLLFFDQIRAPIGENVKTGAALLFTKDDVTPEMPVTEDPQSNQVKV